MIHSPVVCVEQRIGLLTNPHHHHAHTHAIVSYDLFLAVQSTGLDLSLLTGALSPQEMVGEEDTQVRTLLFAVHGA